MTGTEGWPVHAPLSGRRAQAARNDQRILDAARAVFLADPTAPIAAVAERAGVGISALYRRYPSKEELLRTLCGVGLRLYIAEAEAALADTADVWDAFARFMQGIVDIDAYSLAMGFPGAFRVTEDLGRLTRYVALLNVRLFERVRAAGVIRPDIDLMDILLIFEQLAAIKLGDEQRTKLLRRRYLALTLDALRTPSAGPLPGPPPTWDELLWRWTNAQGSADD
jgi:AcrR family transcriptional regulator